MDWSCSVLVSGLVVGAGCALVGFVVGTGLGMLEDWLSGQRWKRKMSVEQKAWEKKWADLCTVRPDEYSQDD